MDSIIKENLQKIRENIASAAKKSGQKPEDITIVGVTKTVEPARIRHFLAAGGKILGENKAQEFLSKYDNPVLAGAEWHFIGHLQSNKVKGVIDKVTLIQSVDSETLAAEIDKRARQADLVMDILLEVNIAGEDKKYGFSPANLERSFENLLNLPNIRMKGLMCIPPFVEKADKTKPYFAKMLKLLVDINSRFNYDSKNPMLTTLSMGMSHDYTVAIAEGANMIRIGTVLFGAR
jgi:hypothetical protein